MDEREKIEALVEFIVNDRRKNPEIWHVGVPNERPITLSLRGRLETTNWQWVPEGNDNVMEGASCCSPFSPGDEWKDHCATPEHVRTMLVENYRGELLEEQWQIYLKIIMRELSTD